MTATATPLTDAEYDARTAAVLSRIETVVDAWLDDDVMDVDQHRTGGLLELEFPDRSKIVVNTQPPLHELWLASRRGGFHFKFVNGQWLDTKDGVEFFIRLSEEASFHAGKSLKVEAS
ncbi:iron donor protein CyaY [Roseateles amylovorans]|uniref:Iron-sulfur cluster assembly protein CyaY n=1 Tax=Roseateles amylovorans TaxID=2978473 RepID=A0ABY6B3C1_9BURK|nr:iron donor protein CyaY [Roseateles amylovorans]UXH79336.1 iron donor protein CyaY [Roseateles amylovorans]